MDRRTLIKALGAGSGLAAVSTLVPGWARSLSGAAVTGPDALSGADIALRIGHVPYRVDGRAAHAFGINGSTPGPLIRLREGQRVRLAVTNELPEDSSIHWHGLLVPFQFDGVPGISFPGIRSGETFVYDFTVRQSGTYWYHGHSNMQEAMGLYGPMIIDPAGGATAPYDREYVLMLSDWSSQHPHQMLRHLKQQSGYFNHDRQTLAGLLAGADQSLRERTAWARMRMDPTDIADVTASAYTYLVNGMDAQQNWTGLFNAGERLRLRVINASAMTIFNLRIPELALTVVQADGQDVRPVEVDELQIGVAETYDLLMTPADRAYTVVAETIDRSGMARATLAPRAGMMARVPPLRARPLLTMRDMGMDHASHAGHDASGVMDHGEHAGHVHAPDAGGTVTPLPPGPGVAGLASHVVDRVGDRGIGLADVQHRVLVYTDLVALTDNPDARLPSRQLQIHLTGNMERYMWSFDGRKYSEGARPIAFSRDERVRITFVNDTMMTHPIHLHGHFFEVVNGHPGRHPRKHTVNVLPGGKLSIDLTANAPGDWPLHCHLLMHMHGGMFQVVQVRPLDPEKA